MKALNSKSIVLREAILNKKKIKRNFKTCNIKKSIKIFSKNIFKTLLLKMNLTQKIITIYRM